MALSDPSNVRVGLARKQALLQKLAAQLGARGGAGRAQGTGSQFNSAVNLRTAGPARLTLPFALPNGKVRPAGFDPDPNAGNAWAAPQDLAVTPSGPPAGAGGGGTTTATLSPPNTDMYSVGATPEQPNPDQYAQINPNPGGVDPGFNITQSDSPLNAPDPYTLMAEAQMRRIAGRMIAS